MEAFKELMTNEYVRTMITTIITALITLSIAGIVNRNKKIKNSVSKGDLDNGIYQAKKYTDDKIVEHEKGHSAINDVIHGIRKDNVRIETKVDKILFLMAQK